MTLSFKTVLRSFAQEDRFYHDDDRHFFPLAILEIAHALSRGRKPASCSFVEGNLQDWLRRMYCEERSDCHDHMGDNCSVADDALDAVYAWAYTDPYHLRLAEAITLCRTLIKPIKKDDEFRGDISYQMRHDDKTNLGRKRAYWAKKQGSHYDYDDSYFAGGDLDFDPIDDLEIDSHIVHNDADPLHEPLDDERDEASPEMRELGRLLGTMQNDLPPAVTVPRVRRVRRAVTAPSAN